MNIEHFCCKIYLSPKKKGWNEVAVSEINDI